VGKPGSRSGRGREEKNFQSLPGLEPPIIQPVAQCCTTELLGSLVAVNEDLILNGKRTQNASTNSIRFFGVKGIKNVAIWIHFQLISEKSLCYVSPSQKLCVD
jgi:hypothetical protein